MDFVSFFVDLFQWLPPWLVVIVISAIPVIELRGAIPVAIGLYGMDPVLAFVLAVIGNMIPVTIIFYFLDPVSKFLSKHSKLFAKFFDWLFNRVEKQGNERVEKYKDLALMTFVAIPLPLTGAWTGTAAALVLKYPFKNAFLSILAGVIIAGIIVTFLTISGIHILDVIFGWFS
ncbi:small multi-drug export protein [Methanimicrococcus sp. OttesenSCG-928-J09]|nr:small multi-drug export protein [Methanimicrococcus sp. OttesenSCG-928-J09]